MAAASAAAAVLPLPSVGAAEGEGKKITMAFVGCAHIHTPSFVNLLKGRKDVTVKYVWDHDQARAARRAGELNAKVMPELKTICEDPEIKAVVVCSETNRHAELVTALAKAGKHMFVEKPLGITAKESYVMAEAIEKARLLFTTGYFMRMAPAHIFLREEVQKGNFGTITRIRGSNCHSGSLGGWFDTEWRWMATPSISGVGGFGDLGTHSLDIMMWLMGGVESVCADIKVVTKRYGDCDECGEGLIKFKNGVTGTLAAGWVDVADPVTLLISGTEAHASIINGKLYYKSNKNKEANGNEPWTRLPEKPADPLHQFVDAVGGKSDAILVSPREAAARVAVMEAMYKSCRARKMVAPA